MAERIDTPDGSKLNIFGKGKTLEPILPPDIDPSQRNFEIGYEKIYGHKRSDSYKYDYLSELKKCKDFLLNNGFTYWLDAPLDMEANDYIHFMKKDSIGIDINEEEMVFIGEEGDFLHLPTNKYTLIGVLIEYRQLPLNYKS